MNLLEFESEKNNLYYIGFLFETEETLYNIFFERSRTFDNENVFKTFSVRLISGEGKWIKRNGEVYTIEQRSNYYCAAVVKMSFIKYIFTFSEKQ